MHEMGVVLGVIKVAEQEAVKYSVNKIDSLTLTIGALTGVIPRYVQSSWSHAVQGTILDGAELIINEIEGKIRCNKCGAEYDPMKHVVDNQEIHCPECEAVNEYSVLKGMELMIEEIGVAE